MSNVIEQPLYGQPVCAKMLSVTSLFGRLVILRALRRSSPPVGSQSSGRGCEVEAPQGGRTMENSRERLARLALAAAIIGGAAAMTAAPSMAAAAAGCNQAENPHAGAL